MDHQLSSRVQASSDEVSVSITAEEQHLEKQDACGPDGWAAAKPGQDVLCNQGLNLEEQECRGEDRHRIGKDSHQAIICSGDDGLRSQFPAVRGRRVSWSTSF